MLFDLTKPLLPMISVGGREISDISDNRLIQAPEIRAPPPKPPNLETLNTQNLVINGVSMGVGPKSREDKVNGMVPRFNNDGMQSSGNMRRLWLMLRMVKFHFFFFMINNILVLNCRGVENQDFLVDAKSLVENSKPDFFFFF